MQLGELASLNFVICRADQQAGNSGRISTSQSSNQIPSSRETLVFALKATDSRYLGQSP